ncbi:hypothetical protein D3C85_1288130 [compost metagenome]
MVMMCGGIFLIEVGTNEAVAHFSTDFVVRGIVVQPAIGICHSYGDVANVPGVGKETGAYRDNQLGTGDGFGELCQLAAKIEPILGQYPVPCRIEPIYQRLEFAGVANDLAQYLLLGLVGFEY